MTRWSQTRRRPSRVLSEITRASQVAPRAAFSQYGVWVIRGNGRLLLIARAACRMDMAVIVHHCCAQLGQVAEPGTKARAAVVPGRTRVFHSGPRPARNVYPRTLRRSSVTARNLSARSVTAGQPPRDSGIFRVRAKTALTEPVLHRIRQLSGSGEVRTGQGTITVAGEDSVTVTRRRRSTCATLRGWIRHRSPLPVRSTRSWYC